MCLSTVWIPCLKVHFISLFSFCEKRSCLFYSTFFRYKHWPIYNIYIQFSWTWSAVQPADWPWKKHDGTEDHFTSERNHLWFAFLEIESRSWNQWTQFRQIFIVFTEFFIAIVVLYDFCFLLGAEPGSHQ